MRITRAQLIFAVDALWLSAIFTLYMAPTKQHMGDLLATALLLGYLSVIGLRWLWITAALKPLIPLLGLLIFVLASDAFYGRSSGIEFIKDTAIGLIPFLLLYFVFRHFKIQQVRFLAVAVFLIPGLIQLGYMYFDITKSIINSKTAIVSVSAENSWLLFRKKLEMKLPDGLPPQNKAGLLENIKEAPRVGRRYASTAMIHLLWGGLLLAVLFRKRAVRYLGWGFAATGMLSLALLDARAAYASILIGGLIIAFIVDRSRLKSVINWITQGGRARLITLIILVGLILAIGFSAGKSRWMSSSYSVHAAIHDVFDSNKVVGLRPYADKAFWDIPIENLDADDIEFRLRVDQSAYLRTAWLLVGLQNAVAHPLGIGYSNDYMSRIFGGGDDKYQRTDNFLVECLVSFGVAGVIFYATLWWLVARSLRRALREGHDASVILIAVGGIMFVCVGRGLVDVFSHGLWRYLMALLGMYYGLLHAGRQRARE